MGGIVHFAPGARTAWHTHPAGQAIFATDGTGTHTT
jgi:quercetin dioxygenase-like cupin family protein